MPLLASRPQVIGSCTRCLRGKNTPAAFKQQFRQATAPAKPRTKKNTVLPTEDSTIAVKKTLSTKSSAAKSPRKPAKTPPSDALSVAKSAKTAKFSRSASTSTPATPKQSTQDSGAAVPPSLNPSPTPPRTKADVPASPGASAEAQAGTKKPLDPKSPEYKKAYKRMERKYMALMVSIPLMLVTSYYLYKRLVVQVAPEVPRQTAPSAEPLPSEKRQPSNA